MALNLYPCKCFAVTPSLGCCTCYSTHQSPKTLMALNLNYIPSRDVLILRGRSSRRMRRRSMRTMVLVQHDDIRAEEKKVVMMSSKLSCHDGRYSKSQSQQLAPEKLEIFKSLEGWVEENILGLLRPVEKSWQPQDFLPEASKEGFMEDVREIRDRAAEIPDECYVCLVGNMITEEALPTYQSIFNTFDGVRDETGSSQTAWARWTRMWSAEENRHGDLLNKYLYLTGKLDMRQVEKTIQSLIAAGMRMDVEKNPYMGLVYASFQEKATAISHGNTARLAKRHGDATLARICGTIAADEKRHEAAYTMIIGKLFEVDPETTMLALAKMMRKRITMPALLMSDGQDADLFQHYMAVGQRIGVYTGEDYAEMVEVLVKRWEVERVTAGLSGEGRQAQEYVCRLAVRMRKTQEMRASKERRRSFINNNNHQQSQLLLPFSWIFNRHVTV